MTLPDHLQSLRRSVLMEVHALDKLETGEINLEEFIRQSRRARIQLLRDIEKGTQARPYRPRKKQKRVPIAKR